MNAVSNVRALRPVETDEVSPLISHYARGFGMLAGMIETMNLADRLGNQGEVRAALDRALAFIAEHDGGTAANVRSQGVRQWIGGAR